jgi:hypothetical protein
MYNKWTQPVNITKTGSLISVQRRLPKQKHMHYAPINKNLPAPIERKL